MQALKPAKPSAKASKLPATRWPTGDRAALMLAGVTLLIGFAIDIIAADLTAGKASALQQLPLKTQVPRLIHADVFAV